MSDALELKPAYSIHPPQEPDGEWTRDKHPSCIYLEFTFVGKRYGGMMYPVEEEEEEEAL